MQHQQKQQQKQQQLLHQQQHWHPLNPQHHKALMLGLALVLLQGVVGQLRS